MFFGIWDCCKLFLHAAIWFEILHFIATPKTSLNECFLVGGTNKKASSS